MDDPGVVVAGTGPAVEAVEAALSDVTDTGAVRRADPEGVDADTDADLAVVVDDAGGDGLRATTAVTAAGTPVVGVERGGVGGRPVAGVEAAVLGLSRAGVCYDCLRTRVTAGEPETGDGTVAPGTARFAGAVAGRAAVAHRQGASTPVFPETPDGDALGGVVEVPHATRRVLPVPGCSCDGGDRFRGLDLAETDRDLEATVERAELALDERVGPVASVGEVESFPVPYYMATLASTAGFSDAEATRRTAGVDPDWNRALMRALGEGLERYAAGVYRGSDLARAPPAAVPEAVGPGAFVRPDDTPAVDPESPIRWVAGVDLAAGRGDTDADGRGVYLPAEAALFPPPTERYLRPVSTGLGLGRDTVGAVLSGLTEVVERDATMLSWYSTFEPLELAVEDETYETLARRARSEGLSTTALLVTVDVDVPVVVAAVHREGEWPRFAAGAAAAVDPTAAARDALTEALQNWTELRSMGRSAAGEESTAIARYAETPGPARRWLDADGPVPADSVADDPPADRSAALNRVLDRLAAAGCEAYAVDLTTRDVARAGFSAVRVVVPDAQPLFVDVDQPFFGERAERVPTELGFETRFDGPPHPFP
jgi:ribosomal protein S12 methylthiotransferase accessory factor